MDFKQLHQFAQQALNQGQFPQAQQALIKLLNADPEFADGYFLLGIIEAELGSFSKAVALMERAIMREQNAEYFAHIAKCYAMMGRANDCFAMVEKTKTYDIKNALTLDTIGVAFSRLGNHATAIEYFQRAIALKPSANFYYNLGASHTFAGDFKAARSAYESAIDHRPLFHQAHSSLTHLGGVDKENNHIERLLGVLSQVSHVDAKLHISHALQREYEAIGEPQTGFDYLQQAKVSKQQSSGYQFEHDAQMFAQIRQCFAKRDEHHSNIDAEPIFVVGMPRSGTTLIERVLTNNAEVKSAGELQEIGLALKQIAATDGRYILDPATIQSAKEMDLTSLGQRYLDLIQHLIKPGERFVDKMPLNVLYGGLIAQALPKAKIVCVIRNGMDTVWGNYKQLFSLTDGYYNYSYDLETTAQYYCQFVALAEFWHSQFPEQFHIVRYDDFVQQPEVLGKQMVEFCGLTFEPEMLDITRNTSAVATASSVQVRSQINTRSIGQWRKYESQLQPAVKIISEAGFSLS